MDLLKNLRSPHNVLNLPNILTFLRLFLIPVIAYFLILDDELVPFHQDWMLRYSPGKIAALLLLIAGITDFLDGYIARLWKIDSLLGKFLDPIADKLLLMVGLVLLMQMGRVSSWLVILLLSREFMITGLRTVAIGEGLVIPAGNWGKSKLVLQLVALGALMWQGSLFGFSASVFGTWVLYFALAVSLISGYNYLSDFFTALKQKRKTS